MRVMEPEYRPWQLGATLYFDPLRGYAPRVAPNGLALEAVFAAGSCAASPLPSAEDGARVARMMPQ